MRMPTEVAWALRVTAKPAFGNSEIPIAKKILARHVEGPCGLCKGTGTTTYPNDGGGGVSSFPCPPCEGTGRLWLPKGAKRHVPSHVSERAVTVPRATYGWRGLSTGSRMLDKEKP